MSAQLLTERYQDRLAGVLSCYDRIVITGTLPSMGRDEAKDLVEAAGGKVAWSHSSKEVRADGLGHKVWFQNGNANARVDEESVGLEKAPFIKNSRIILPLSFLSSALDVAIHFDPATGHVLIASTKAQK